MTKKTMSVAQQLYEGVEVKKFGTVGLITYMRTDSVRISKEVQEKALNFIDETYGKSMFQRNQEYIKERKYTRCP